MTYFYYIFIWEISFRFCTAETKMATDIGNRSLLFDSHLFPINNYCNFFPRLASTANQQYYNNVTVIFLISVNNIICYITPVTIFLFRVRKCNN